MLEEKWKNEDQSVPLNGIIKERLNDMQFEQRLEWSEGSSLVDNVEEEGEG